MTDEESNIPGILENGLNEASKGIRGQISPVMSENVTNYACRHARANGEPEKAEKIIEWAEKMDYILGAALKSGDTVYECEACNHHWFGAESAGTCPQCNRRAPVTDVFD